MSTRTTSSHRDFTNLQDRVQQHAARVNQPIVCSACSGTHFYTVRMEEFADNGLYLNHLRSISATSEAMHICACGTPVAMKDTAQGKGSERPRGRFLKSLQLAVKFQKKSDPQNLAQGFISLAEYTELRDHVLMQQDQIEDLLVAVETMARANGGDTEEGI